MSEAALPLVSATAGESSVAIKNLSNAKIQRAVYMSSSGLSDVFDLAPGGEQNLSLSAPSQPSSFNGWYLTQLEPGSDEAQVFQELGALLDREVGGDRAFTQGFFGVQLLPDVFKRLERPLLIGFIDEGSAGVGFQGSLKRRSKALYVVHL
jgi:hypothetical protein